MALETTSVETLGRQPAGLEIRQVGRLLIGKEVEVSVGEPWDFEGPEGPGLLTGRVINAGQTDAGDVRTQWIELAVTPFDSEEGVKVRRLIAGRRYADERGIVEQVASGEDAGVNLSYADQVPDDKRLPGVIPKLIGGLRLAG